jgi:hypothetical protein
MFAPLFHWLYTAQVFTDLRESALVYPIVLSLHLTFIALFGGLILVTDLRLLGYAMKSYPAADVVNGLRPWKHLGITLMVLAGFLLGAAKADNYYPNPFFWTKLTLLLAAGVHAIVFRKSVYAKAEEFDRTGVIPGNAKMAAWLSLIIWTSIACMGRLIAYWEPPQAVAHLLK